jgi:hypothetical protein
MAGPRPLPSPHQQHSAASALCQALTEVVRQIQMRQDVESHHRVQCTALDGQEGARNDSARVGDQQANVKILGSLLNGCEKALLAEVYPNGSIVHPEFMCKLAPQCFQEGETACHQHQIQSAGRQLPCEFFADT